MTKEELQSRVDALKWYHRVRLPHGIVTPGWAPLWPEHYRLPDDLTGKRVLDVGTYDGYWAFECLRRWASQVVAIDDFSDTIHAGEQRSWDQFDLCHEAFGYSDIQCWHDKASVYDAEAYGEFDLVLLLGVIYHLKHPLLALERLRAAMNPGGMIIVESHICDHYSPYKEGGHGDLPVMEFFPDDQLAGCQTNWWAPSLRCLSTMMRVAGFSRVEAWKIEHPSDMAESRGYLHGYVE